MTGISIKYYLNVVIVFGCLSFCLASETLKPLDLTRDIYQKKEGFPSKVITWPILGGVIKCRLPDPVTIAELKKQLEMQGLRHEQEIKEQAANHKSNQHAWGSVAIGVGWILIAIGAAAHFATSIPLVKSASSSIITLGGFTVVGGLGMQMTVEYDFFLKCALLILVVGWIAYRLYKHRDLHLPDKIPSLQDIKNATINRVQEQKKKKTKEG